MKTHSDVLCKRLDELAAAVAAGPVAVAREFTMCIPAQPDRDADIVLSDAAQRIRDLESVLREALDANQFNSHGWVHRAITLLEPPR